MNALTDENVREKHEKANFKRTDSFSVRDELRNCKNKLKDNENVYNITDNQSAKISEKQK